MRRAIIFAFLFSIIIIDIAVFSGFVDYYAFGFSVKLKSFSSYDELRSFISASLDWGRSRRFHLYYSGLRFFPLNSRVSFMKSSALESNLPDYSKTNIQVEGVDEADLVKTDGEYIYLSSGSRVYIVHAYPAEDLRVESILNFNGSLMGLFVYGDRLIVFEQIGYGLPYLDGDVKVFPVGYGFHIKIFDVEDKGNPVLKRDLALEGSYLSSRMIDEYLYVVSSQPAVRILDCEGGFDVIIPKVYFDGELHLINASQIFYSPNVTDVFCQYIVILAVNVLEDDLKPTCKVVLGGFSSSMYMSINNIYVTMTDCSSNIESTIIHRIRVDDGELIVEASGRVPGRILNQFSMDEYDGYFRIATTTGHVARFLSRATSRNHIYILDMNLNVTGRLENLAPGERIYSARFMGDRCYLVTFRKVDPLFVIDLSDPENPRVLGKLKIPGYSDYLHPVDENHIIGIGKETVEAEEGDFAWYQGVKISLFDVSDPEKPKQIVRYVIGDRGTDSPILRDHHAFLFSLEKHLMVIPVLLAEIDSEKYPDGVPPNAYGDFVWQGVYVFNVDVDNLTLRGRITHIGDEDEFLKSGFYFSSPYSIKRALYIGNILYTISDGMIKACDLGTLDEVNSIVLMDL